MSKKVLIIAILLLRVPLVLFAADPMDQLASAIQAKDWSKGMRVCNGIPGTESRRSERRGLAGSHFAELAMHCAVAASGAGDRWRSNWWWSTAAAMDVDTAQSLLPRFQSQGLLLDLLPPRMHSRAEASEPRLKGRVRLPNGELIAGKRARPRNPRIPAYLTRGMPGVAPSKVEIDFIVDEEGVLWQPVAVSTKALPVQVFLALCFVGEWRFFPAVVDGVSVASTYTLTVALY